MIFLFVTVYWSLYSIGMRLLWLHQRYFFLFCKRRSRWHVDFLITMWLGVYQLPILRNYFICLLAIKSRKKCKSNQKIKSWFLQNISEICQCQCGLLLNSSGIGPKRAVDLIKQYKSIEEIVKHIDTNVSVCLLIFVLFFRLMHFTSLAKSLRS